MDKNILVKDKKFSDREVRFALQLKIEKRAEGDQEEMILEGYALKFENETLIGDKSWGWYEVIKRGALDNADLNKVPLKYNHDNSYLAIASTKNGSLELRIDDVGLYFVAKLIETNSNKDIYAAVRSGLIDECSFMFAVDYENEGEYWVKTADVPRREITKIKRLYDISVVDLPAYDNTTVSARSIETLEEVEKTRKAALEEEARNRTAAEAAKKQKNIEARALLLLHDRNNKK